jgi:hypothetical protein
MDAQSPGSPTRDSFGTPPWESREKVPFRCILRGELQRILYGGRWWLPRSLGRAESSESKVARGLSQHQKCRNPNLAKCGGEAQHLEKLGIWSPPGLPNVQSSTAGPKTPRIGAFLLSLERS